jgi:hypothetical protein
MTPTAAQVEGEQYDADAVRQCYECKVILPRSAFSASSRNKDGILHMCRECNRAHVKAWKARNPQARRAIADRWAKSERGKLTASRRLKMERRAHPEKHAARATAWRAIRSGAITPKPCEVCGAEKVDAHHDDYSKPLEVRWLCRPHHQQHHRDTEQI